MATGQDAGFEDAPFLYLDLATGLRVEQNLDTPDERSFDTRLGAGVFTATSDRRFSLETGVLLQTLEGDRALTDPFVALSYAIFARETELSFDLDYTSLDLEDAPLDDGFDAEDLIDDGGRRDRIEARIGLVTGRESPFGTESALTFRQNSFTDGAAEDDDTLVSFGTTLRFLVDPRISLRLGAFASERDIEDAGNSVETVRQAGFGADVLIDRAWTASLDLGFREIATETDVLGLRQRSVIDGVEAGLLLTREMRNGTLVFSAERDVIDTGFRDTITLARSLELANGGELDASVGLVIFEGADPVAIFGTAYSNEIRRGSLFSFSLDRSGGVTEDDENVIRTRLAAGLVQELTPTSSLSLDASALRIEDATLSGTDTSRFDIALAYRHALTEDWTLAARAGHLVIYDGDAVDDRATTLSLGIERRFSLRP